MGVSAGMVDFPSSQPQESDHVNAVQWKGARVLKAKDVDLVTAPDRTRAISAR
jgi:hypothetical protein